MWKSSSMGDELQHVLSLLKILFGGFGGRGAVPISLRNYWAPPLTCPHPLHPTVAFQILTSIPGTFATMYPNAFAELLQVFSFAVFNFSLSLGR